MVWAGGTAFICYQPHGWKSLLRSFVVVLGIVGYALAGSSSLDGATFGARRSVVDCASLTAPSFQQVEFVAEIGEEWPDIMFPGNQYMQFMLGSSSSPHVLMDNAVDDAEAANRSEVAMNNAVDDAEAAAISLDAADEAVAQDRLLTPSKAINS